MFNGMKIGAVAAALCFCAGFAFAGAEDFTSITPGTVVSGAGTNGSPVAGNTHFADFTLGVVNNGTGPNSALIFDSASPVAQDADLGTPNQGCNGPGVGTGGAPGQSGENCTAQGNLLVIASTVSDGNNDGLVDNPCDESGGGELTFEFDRAVAIQSAGFVDLDRQEHANITFYNGNNLAGTKYVVGLGDNSYQDVDLSLYGQITKMIVEMSGSGAIAAVNYGNKTATQQTTWGSVKTDFR